jgi:hypothetical protein
MDKDEAQQEHEPENEPYVSLASVQEPVADFDDAQVQTVYNILCDADEGKPREEHWEGWKARRIVAALTAPPAAQPAPVQEPVNQRAYEMALRQWESWKQYALELQEKLVKYEGGAPMVLNTTPPAQPAPVQPIIGSYLEKDNSQFKFSDYESDGVHHNKPAVPDAFGTREGEHPQYIQGWNDCRAEMLKGMK